MKTLQAKIVNAPTYKSYYDNYYNVVALGSKYIDLMINGTTIQFTLSEIEFKQSYINQKGLEIK